MVAQQMSRQAAFGEADIRSRLSSLGEWFHNIDLGGIQTAPNHFLGDFPGLKWKKLSKCLPADLSGKSVLDIGCNAGFYSLEMKKRHAARVVGIDSDVRYLTQARFAAEVHDFDIEYRQMSVYEVGSLHERFDIVLFMGVLYHLRYPLLALDLLAEHVVKDVLVFQTLMRGGQDVLTPQEDYPFSETGVFNEPGYPVLHFVEKSYSGDPTNWWIPNRACSEAMLRSAGFRVESRPDNDTFLCSLIPSNDPKYYLEELRASRTSL